MAKAKRKEEKEVVEPINAEVVDTDTAPESAEPFYLIEIFTGEGNPIQFRSTDPAAAQQTMEECTRKGTFTFTIENGAQCIPVKTARVTGPYVEQPKEETVQ